MKTAKTQPAAIFVDCPHCGEALPHPVTGSHLWECNDPVTETVLTCNACRLKSKTPKSMIRRGE